MDRPEVKEWLFIMALMAAVGGGGASVQASERAAGAPPCLSDGRNLDINDSQVLEWETSTAPEFHGRAHVSGPITRVFPDLHGHQHFLVQIGPEPTAGVEIVFDTEEGKIDDLAPGEQAEACGDFINTTGEEGHGAYTSAIIHWVHAPFRHSSHDPGFVIVNGVLYGMDP